MSKQKYDELFKRMQTLVDLSGIGGIAYWDMQTHMPSKGAAVRGERLATLTRISHGMLVDKATGDAINAAEDYVRGQGEESVEFAQWRQFKRLYDKSAVIPTELAAEMNLAKSKGR